MSSFNLTEKKKKLLTFEMLLLHVYDRTNIRSVTYWCEIVYVGSRTTGGPRYDSRNARNDD